MGGNLWATTAAWTFLYLVQVLSADRSLFQDLGLNTPPDVTKVPHRSAPAPDFTSHNSSPTNVTNFSASAEIQDSRVRRWYRYTLCWFDPGQNFFINYKVASLWPLFGVPAGNTRLRESRINRPELRFSTLRNPEPALNGWYRKADFDAIMK
jgi:hypothetical protein